MIKKAKKLDTIKQIYDEVKIRQFFSKNENQFRKVTRTFYSQEIEMPKEPGDKLGWVRVERQKAVVKHFTLEGVTPILTKEYVEPSPCINVSSNDIQFHYYRPNKDQGHILKVLDLANQEIKVIDYANDHNNHTMLKNTKVLVEGFSVFKESPTSFLVAMIMFLDTKYYVELLRLNLTDGISTVKITAREVIMGPSKHKCSFQFSTMEEIDNEENKIEANKQQEKLKDYFQILFLKNSPAYEVLEDKKFYNNVLSLGMIVIELDGQDNRVEAKIIKEVHHKSICKQGIKKLKNGFFMTWDERGVRKMFDVKGKPQV